MTITTSEAARHFAAKLQFETDPSDVKAAMDAGERSVLVDSRGEADLEAGVLQRLHATEEEAWTRRVARRHHADGVATHERARPVSL